MYTGVVPAPTPLECCTLGRTFEYERLKPSVNVSVAAVKRTIPFYKRAILHLRHERPEGSLAARLMYSARSRYLNPLQLHRVASLKSHHSHFNTYLTRTASGDYYNFKRHTRCEVKFVSSTTTDLKIALA